MKFVKLSDTAAVRVSLERGRVELRQCTLLSKSSGTWVPGDRAVMVPPDRVGDLLEAIDAALTPPDPSMWERAGG